MLQRVKSHSEVNPEARWIQVAQEREPYRQRAMDTRR